jgi:AraC-like DNA-binding protein
VSCLILDLTLQMTMGLEASFTLLNYIRPIFFVLVSYILTVFFRQNQRREVFLIGIGTVLLLFSTLFTALFDLVHWQFVYLWHETVRLFHIKNLPIPIYSVRIGVLLEVSCFSFALYLKSKRERLEKTANEEHLLTLTAANEQLKKELDKAATIQTVINGEPHVVENDFILRGVKIVEENYSKEDFSVEDFARLMLVSRSTLYREYEDALNISPSDYIRNYRIGKAKDLLLTTKKDISEIAYAVGFKNASNFSKAFSKIMSLSPSKFREENTI